MCWQEHHRSCPLRSGQHPWVHELDLVVRRLHRGQLWVQDVSGDTPVCMPDGVLLDGCLRTTHNAPFLFPCNQWHKTFPFQGERWVITAYHMPGVAHHVINGLGFPTESPQLPSRKRSLSPQEAPPQEPTMHVDEAALSVMRAAADKFLEPQPTLPVPRGSSVGFSPEPSASARPLPHALAPPSLGRCGSRPETPCQRVTCERPLVIELCCGTALLSALRKKQATLSFPLTGVTISTSRMCGPCRWICAYHPLGHFSGTFARRAPLHGYTLHHLVARPAERVR